MIAYNNSWLDNLFVQQQTNYIHELNCITKIEQAAINEKYPVGFFTPNIFIRIGLFLLTNVVAVFSLGLFSLLLMAALENSVAGLVIFYGLITYAALEFMIASKHHFKSGVDDALIWISAALIFGGISYGLDASALAMCCIAFCMAMFYTIRFADRLMALAVFISVIGILFFTCSRMGGIVKAIVPFVIMIASAATYFLCRTLEKKNRLRHYNACLTILIIAALVCFYIGGNYFIVRELSNSMFNLNLQEGESIPYAGLFWAFTIATPIIYVAAGIKRKDQILIQTGLALVAATILTIRFYYPVMNVEVEMTIGGIALILGAYALIKFLKRPRYGFTYEPAKAVNNTGALQIESLVIAETFSTTVVPAEGTKFGGGSFGGGGAGSEF